MSLFSAFRISPMFLVGNERRRLRLHVGESVRESEGFSGSHRRGLYDTRLLGEGGFVMQTKGQ